MKNSRVVLLVLILVSIFSCNTNSKEKEILKQVKAWQGKKIVFPEKLLYAKYAMDTLPYEIPDADYKILLYVDSSGCTSCKLKLHKWKQLINEIDSISNKSVAYMFFFQSKDIRELNFLLRRNDIDFPVYIDTENIFNKLNKFSNNPILQCFLIDKDNKVVVIGNPIYNYKVKDLYVSKIKKEKHLHIPETQTSIKLLSPKKIELGDIKFETSKTIDIIIENTGKQALQIMNIDTSCGCTKVDYDNKPTKPNEKTIIKIQYTADKMAFFNKSVKIWCNTHNSPITIEIKGIVKA